MKRLFVLFSLALLFTFATAQDTLRINDGYVVIATDMSITEINYGEGTSLSNGVWQLVNSQISSSKLQEGDIIITHNGKSVTCGYNHEHGNYYMIANSKTIKYDKSVRLKSAVKAYLVGVTATGS